MKIRSIGLALTSALLASCSLWSEPAKALDSPVFRYGLRGERSAGVVQAFTKGGKTYIQFLDLDRAKPVFAGDDGQVLAYEPRGQYAVLPGELDLVEVTAIGGQVDVYALDRAPPKRRPPARAVVAAAVESMPAAPAVRPAALRAAVLHKTFTFATSQFSVQSMDPAQREDLQRFAAGLKAQPEAADAEVRVIGHADPRGLYCTNMQLSFQRADSIAAVLRASGLSKVAVYGRGPLDPVDKCEGLATKLRDECLRASRRVVVEMNGEG